MPQKARVSLSLMIAGLIEFFIQAALQKGF